MTKEVAIIIPVFKASMFISNLLESIQSQTCLNKIKLFLVIDGDKEDYNFLTTTFPDIDIDIQYLKENCGPGIARNYAIKKTVEEKIPYIIFADSDDEFYGKYAIEFLLNTIKETNLPLVRSPIITQAFNNIYFYEQNGNLLFGKIYKTELIKNNNITFFPLNYEDGCFNLLYLLNCGFNFYDFPYPIYLWKDNPNSLCRKDNGIFCQETFLLDFDNLIKTYQFALTNPNIKQEDIIYSIPDRLFYFYNIYKQQFNTLKKEVNEKRKYFLKKKIKELTKNLPIITEKLFWESFYNNSFSWKEIYSFYMEE